MGHEVGLCLQRSWKPAPHWFVNRQRQKLELQPPTDCRCEQFVAASDCSAEARWLQMQELQAATCSASLAPRDLGQYSQQHRSILFICNAIDLRALHNYLSCIQDCDHITLVQCSDAEQWNTKLVALDYPPLYSSRPRTSNALQKTLLLTFLKIPRKVSSLHQARQVLSPHCISDIAHSEECILQQSRMDAGQCAIALQMRQLMKCSAVQMGPKCTSVK